MRRFGLVLTVCLMLIPMAWAADEDMPPMGPPEEMKMVAPMVGAWDVAMTARMAPDQPWEESNGSCTYEMILDGSALLQKFEGSMGGMPFSGESLMCFNRETKKWQVTWIDNMACMLSIYEGKMKDGQMVVSGEDMWQGIKFLSRNTTFNITDTRFEWTMENSMDGGKTWYESMKSVYTKKK